MKILDQYGQPFDTRALNEPQTARIAMLQNDVLESQLDGLTPARAARILKEADAGSLIAQHQLFDDMYDRDAHIRCEYDKRTGAVVGLDWQIVPPHDANEAEIRATEWVDDVLRNAVDDFEDVIIAMMEGPGHGFAPIELAWQKLGREWIPNFYPRPQTWFQPDNTRSAIHLIDGTPEGAAPIPMGWILHQHKKVKTGYIGRAGLSRTLIWPFIYKSYGIGDFAEFLETWGIPFVLGKYHPAATKAEKDSLMRAIAQLGHNGRAIMSDEMKTEIHQATASGGASNPHMTMVEWAEKSVSKAILGQVLSAEAKSTGLGSGVANLQREVRRDVLLADAVQIAGTLTRDLVYPLITLNLGGIDGMRRCPRFTFDLREFADVATYAEAVPKLVGVGMRIKRSWLHEKLGIPEADDDDALSVPHPEMTFSPALREMQQAAASRYRLAAARQPSPRQTATDALAAALATAAQPVVDDWVDRIRLLIDMHPDWSMTDLYQALLEQYSALPAADLIEMMTSAYQVADAAGRSQVQDGN